MSRRTEELKKMLDAIDMLDNVRSKILELIKPYIPALTEPYDCIESGGKIPEDAYGYLLQLERDLDSAKNSMEDFTKWALDEKEGGDFWTYFFLDKAERIE